MIDSPHHPHVKALRKLSRADERRARGRAILPTTRLIDAALRAGVVIEEVLIAAAASAEDVALAERAVSAGARRIEISARALRAVAGVESPPPVAAVVHVPPRASLDAGAWRRLAVADGIADPGNLGTLIRTADAAGFDGVVLLDGTVDPFSPKALRASAGSALSLPLLAAADAEISARARVLVADPDGDVDFRETDYTPPIALVFGSEAHGPRRPWAGAVRVRVPNFGRAESLNVAAAAALFLYEARRGDRAPDADPPSPRVRSRSPWTI
jgi:TrmH family RNA methyltransferase